MVASEFGYIPLHGCQSVIVSLSDGQPKGQPLEASPFGGGKQELEMQMDKIQPTFLSLSEYLGYQKLQDPLNAYKSTI
jgi:hypothetical protein